MCMEQVIIRHRGATRFLFCWLEDKLFAQFLIAISSTYIVRSVILDLVMYSILVPFQFFYKLHSVILGERIAGSLRAPDFV